MFLLNEKFLPLHFLQQFCSKQQFDVNFVAYISLPGENQRLRQQNQQPEIWLHLRPTFI